MSSTVNETYKNHARAVLGRAITDSVGESLEDQAFADAVAAKLKNLGITQEKIQKGVLDNMDAVLEGPKKTPVKSLGAKIFKYAPATIGAYAGIEAAKASRAAASKNNAMKKTLTRFVNPTMATIGTLGGLGLAGLVGGAGYLGYKHFNKESNDKTISPELIRKLRLA